MLNQTYINFLCNFALCTFQLTRTVLFEDTPPSKKHKSSDETTTSISVTPTVSSTTVSLSAGPYTSPPVSASTPCPSTSAATPMETEEVSIEDDVLPFTDTTVATPASVGKCAKCGEYREKRRQLLKKHNRLVKRFSKLEERLKKFPHVQVFFF